MTVLNRPWAKFALIQGLSLVLFATVLILHLPLYVALILASISATIAAWRWHAEKWWLLIHAFFLPLVVAAQALQLPSYVYLIAFVVSWLLFGRIAQSRVPLFLSEREVLQQLATQLPKNAVFLDVGAGTGRVLAYLVKERPDLTLVGVEYAFLPWLMGRFCLPSQIEWLKSDYQKMDFSRFDCVYAYLSPAAMPQLWLKAKDELKSGSWLLSNSFEIAGQLPTHSLQLADWKNGKLLIWQM